MNKSIFVFALMDLNYSTGASRRTIRQLSVMKSHGFSPIVLATEAPVEVKKQFKIYEVGKYTIMYSANYIHEIKKEFEVTKKAFFKTLLLLVKSSSRIVYIHSSTRLLPQLFVFILAKLMRKKIIYDYHDLLPETATFMRGLSHDSLLYKILLIYEKFVFSISDYIFVVSDTMRDLLVHRYPYARTKTFVVYTPVSDVKTKLAFPHENKYDIIKKFKLPKDSIIFVYVGKLEPKIRGLELLVNAFINIKKRKMQKRPIYLILIGDGPLKNWILNKINEEEADNIILTGSLPHTDTVSVIMQSHVAVLPYPHAIDAEIALPAKLLEYMALEKLILSSNLIQAKKTLNGCAIYFDPNDVNSLIRKILDIASNFRRYMNYGKLCRKIFLEKLSWDVTKKKYIKLLNAVCK